MNLFICDIIEDGIQISEIILIEKVSGELELLEMKKNQALQMPHKDSSMIEFWKLVPESKYPKLFTVYFRFLAQLIVVNLCTNEVPEIETSFTVDQSTSYRISGYSVKLILRRIKKFRPKIVVRCSYTFYL